MKGSISGVSNSVGEGYEQSGVNQVSALAVCSCGVGRIGRCSVAKRSEIWRDLHAPTLLPEGKISASDGRSQHQNE